MKIFVCALTIGAMCLALFGCGPSKLVRTQHLLHECREANREHVRLLKMYDSVDCETRPGQGFGAAESDLAGFK